MSLNSRIAVFPGSFDPFTKGHQDIVLRGVNMFDKVIISLGVNSTKKRYFEVDFMIKKIQETFRDYPQIEVTSYSGLTAQFAKEANAKYILRGLRNTTDFEYENAISQGNKNLFPDLETVFLITSPELAYISSTITREIHKYGGDVSHYLPYDL